MSSLQLCDVYLQPTEICLEELSQSIAPLRNDRTRWRRLYTPYKPAINEVIVERTRSWLVYYSERFNHESHDGMHHGPFAIMYVFPG